LRQGRAAACPKEQASLVCKHRFLIVKRATEQTKGEWGRRVRLFAYPPEVRPPWPFREDLDRLLDDSNALGRSSGLVLL
jgi:hypothetical protein